MTGTTFANGYALLIGVGYDLPITVKDATALYDVLVDPARAAYPPEQVKLVTEAGATRQKILDAFDLLIEQVKSNPEATVIVYFSGHGGEIKEPLKHFLLPYGYDMERLAETTISSLEFTAKIEALQTRKLVVFLDCCHANGIPTLKKAGSRKAIPLSSNLLRELDTGNGRVIIASSHSDQYSYTGTPYSVFTTCLLEALAGKAATEQDGFARIFNVLNYLVEQVPKRAPKPQEPMLNRADNLDNFPLCYYAGGSKTVPNQIQQPISIKKNLTDRERDRLQERYDLLLLNRNTLVERVKLERKAWGFAELYSSKALELENIVGDLDKAILKLDTELSSIEQKLF